MLKAITLANQKDRKITTVVNLGIGLSLYRARRQINLRFTIDVVPLTRMDSSTNFAKDISFFLRKDGNKLRGFQKGNPLSIQTAVTEAQEISIYAFDPNGIVSKVYQSYRREVRDIGENQYKKQH